MIKVAKPFVGQEEIAAVSEVLLSGNYVSGSKVAEFEEAFAKYIGTKYAVAVNSGTAALHLSLAALGIGPGYEVIVPPLTFFSTVSAVLHQNAIPVFADINPETYCLDPSDVAKKITENTKAVIAVHLFGQASEMDDLLAVTKDRGIPVIEDCAQAHGTLYNGNVVGSIGRIGAFSFFATKQMTTGEGGMVTTSDKDIADKARIMRSHGMADRDTHTVLGYNYRMTEIAAAIGLVQLTKLPYLNEKRIKNSFYLIKALKELDWLKPCELKSNIEHTFFWVPFGVKEEVIRLTTSEVIKRLRENGVEVRHRYKEPIYRQPVLLNQKGYGEKASCLYSCPNYKRPCIDYGKIHLPNAEKVAGKLIGLPNHPGLTNNELDYVVQAVMNIAKRA
jgi:perosamine synthetase